MKPGVAQAPPASAGLKAEPTKAPRFTVRFTQGSAELVLGSPLLFEGGVLRALGTAVGSIGRVTDFSRGWRALADRRSTVLSVELEVELDEVLGFTAAGAELAASGGVGGWVLASTGNDRVLLERRRPWGHVALELAPVWDERDLLLVPVGARSMHRGPAAPLSELGDLARRLVRLPPPHQCRLDLAHGALRFGDVLTVALTEALVGHGVRVPELGPLLRGVRLVGTRLLLSAARGEVGSGAAPLKDAALRELGRTIAAGLSAVVVGEGVTSERVAGWPAELVLAAGLPVNEVDTPGPGARLEALRRWLADPKDSTVPAWREEALARAREIDAEERAPGVATDALLAVLARCEADPATARELLARAFARSPSRPEVLAASLEVAGHTADRGLAREILTSTERESRARGDRIDPWLDVALARIEEQLGEHDAALSRWERASRSPLALPETFEGLARQLARHGRLVEAVSALERASALYTGADRPLASARTRLAAARISLAAREPRAALMRLSALSAELVAPFAAELEVEIRVLEARAYREAGEPAQAERAELSLIRHVDRAGTEASDDAVAALLDAARAAMADDAGSRADAILEVVQRARPGDARGHELLIFERATLLSRIEQASAGERTPLARRAADRLRARGRLADAAEVLARAGELDRDLALLRAAIDLAERVSPELSRKVIQRTLAVVGDGPARAALEERARTLGSS